MPDEKEIALYWKCRYICELEPIGGKAWAREQKWCAKQIKRLEKLYTAKMLYTTVYLSERFEK